MSDRKNTKKQKKMDDPSQTSHIYVRLILTRSGASRHQGWILMS
jgi:hypothetical protein